MSEGATSFAARGCGRKASPIHALSCRCNQLELDLCRMSNCDSMRGKLLQTSSLQSRSDLTAQVCPPMQQHTSQDAQARFMQAAMSFVTGCTSEAFLSHTWSYRAWLDHAGPAKHGRDDVRKLDFTYVQGIQRAAQKRCRSGRGKRPPIAVSAAEQPPQLLS